MSQQQLSVLKTTFAILWITGISAILFVFYGSKLNTSFSYWPRHLYRHQSYLQNDTPVHNRKDQTAQPQKFDFKSSVHPPSSKIYLKNKQISNKIGDVINVDIILVDHYGRRKSRGGDMVRIWVKDLTNRACSAGSVTDNNDGSYTGVIKLLWAGNITIVAGIAASRELMELMYYKVRNGRLKGQLIGKFQNGKISQNKNCTAMETVSVRYGKTCNLTHLNSNLPWYCEEPEKLRCEDLKSTAHFSVSADHSQEEDSVLESVLSNQQINTTVQLTVQGGRPRHAPKGNVTCNNLPPKTTWTTRTPVGYMYDGTWYSTQCINTFDGSVKAFTKCLEGRKLWLFGDSTTRQFFTYFQRFLHLELKTEKWGSSPWHKPSLIANKQNTLSVFWGIHAMPFRTGRRFGSVTMPKGTHLYIDEIPADSKDIILIHFYLHFMDYDPSIVRRHIRKTVESVKALKTRAPEVKVLVKGSNAFRAPKHLVGQLYDFWGVVYDRILKDEFAFVADDVIFLDLWDITVAAESWDRHPNDTVLVPVIRQMMAYVCP